MNIKNTLSFLGTICLIASSVGSLHSCRNSKDDPAEDTFIIPNTKFSLTKDQLKNVAGTNDLSFRLFSTAYSNESYPDSWKPITYDVNNMSLSPFGIQLIEAMMANQVSNHSIFLKMAGLDGGGDFNDYFGTLVKDLENQRNNKDAVILSNVLIRHPEAVELKDSYLSLLKSVYNTPEFVFSDVYSEEEAPWNKWTKEKTKGIIDNIPSELTISCSARFSSAACFNSSWKQGKDGKNLFYDGEKFSSASLSLGDGTYMLTILLPNQGSGVKDVIDNLTAQVWEDLRTGLKWKKASVSVPEINASTVYEHLTFLMDSDFKSDCINQVQVIYEPFGYITYILSNSQSTSLSIKAESSTAPVSDYGDNNPFVANRPFVYLISEAGSGLIMFIGTYSGS